MRAWKEVEMEKTEEVRKERKTKSDGMKRRKTWMKGER